VSGRVGWPTSHRSAPRANNETSTPAEFESLDHMSPTSWSCLSETPHAAVHSTRCTALTLDAMACGRDIDTDWTERVASPQFGHIIVSDPLDAA
jgi:hypothetical protein